MTALPAIGSGGPFGSRAEQVTLIGQDDGLRPVADIQLLQDPRDVGLDRRVAEEQLAADFGVGQTLRDEPEHVSLARGEVSMVLGGGRRCRGVNCAMTFRVTEGDRSASPAAMVRTAAMSCSGGSSFSTNPLAPARSASYRYSSRLTW